MAKGSSVIAVNRKAYHNYHIQESLEAGIVLKGSEIKSIRAHIASYDAASYNTHEPTRPRKLLLHRKEINSLAGKVVQKGLTLVPLRLYIKHGVAKVELGMAKGKKLYDKKEAIARRDTDREIERAMKHKRR